MTLTYTVFKSTGKIFFKRNIILDSSSEMRSAFSLTIEIGTLVDPYVFPCFILVSRCSI